MSEKQMPEEYPDRIKMYDHVSNSGIVHMPGRRFPGITIQGDSMSNLLSQALYFMRKAREHNDEDMFYEARDLAQILQCHLLHYEEILEKEGFEKPYVIDVKALNLEQEFEDS
jgi:hypothetical protein